MKASAAVYATVLRQIERPLINHLNDPTKTGVDFADALMNFHGKVAYDSIRELGKDTILALLGSYPPIAQVITPIPERISVFLDEFLDAERILAEEEEGDEDGGEGEIPGPIIDIKPDKVTKVRSRRPTPPIPD